jgi:hypothetical protein
VRGSNVPLGTQVTVGLVNGSPQGTSTPGTLSGTFESSSATATISGLNRGAVTYLMATATFEPPATAANVNPEGPNKVAKVRVEAALGGKQNLLFLRSNGSAIETAKVPEAIRKIYGQ